MNSHFILPIFATFLLFVFSPHTATAQVTDIFDTDGDAVQVGKLYYVLPVVQRRGGGIATAPASTTQSCPLYVVQENNTAALGTPVKFDRAIHNNTNVTFSSDMNIAFASSNACNEYPVWKLKPSEGTGPRFVGLGGKLNARGPKEVDNWFRIERFFPRFNFDYKFVYCPTKTICPTCEPSCGDLGVYVQGDGTWRLGVGAPPLRIKFKKA